jgi:hypothetical protein
MTQQNIQYCTIVGLGRTMVLHAQGRHGFDGVVGSGRTMALLAKGQHGSMVSRARERHRVHNVVGSRRTTLLQAREWHHGHGDDACMINGVTDSGRGRGTRPWSRTTAQRLRGGLDDGTEAPGRT